MAEEKKRFPWWLIVCAVLFVPLAAVFRFIETVGREGTILGRYERVTEGMKYDDAARILGTPDDEGLGPSRFLGPASLAHYSHWSEGPSEVWVEVSIGRSFGTECCVRGKASEVSRRFSLWHLRRWAEQAYAALHGPHR
jgi:hypothetical protein